MEKVGAFPQRKFGFMGVGNLSQSILEGLIQTGTVYPRQIWASNRSPGKLQKISQNLGLQSVKTNEELIDQCDVIILAMKPQDLLSAIEPIATSFQPHHVVMSLAAGISLKSLKKFIPNAGQLIRVMPNTAIAIRQSVIGYCLSEGARGLGSFVERLFGPLGLVVQVEEGDELEALTVSCSSGVGFVLELMQYWQEWLEEHGFDATVARQMTVQTFLGASQLAHENGGMSLTDLQSKVVSKKGVTAAGIDSMQELEVERLLRYSFEKAVLRDRELGRV